MADVGIRALKQNASAVVARAAAGEIITITDRGRPVAQLSPIKKSRLDQMVESGLVTAPTKRLSELREPVERAGVRLSETVAAMRDDERY